jgi:glucose 1-dehydrogenase
MKLFDKVVFITDADSCLGQSIIKRLAAEGAAFVLNSVSDGENIKNIINELNILSIKSIVINSKLCSSNELDSIIIKIENQLGKIDVLIHNNNEVKPCEIDSCSEELYNYLININVKSAFICTKVIGKHMIKSKSGKVIYVSSIHDEKPTGCSFPYSAAKGALKMLSKEAALELGEHGINVNLIEVGALEGDNDKFKDTSSFIYENFVDNIPGKSYVVNEDISDLVLFLASNDCRHINGTDIRVDGGFVLHYLDKLPEEEMKEV